jgi:RNA polymerase sigma factor (sigma-70 family)
MPDSVELLRQYAEKRTESAFTEIVRQNIDFVYSVALRQLNGDTHLAEDVTQRVFADLARKAAPLSRLPTISGWLYRSTHYAAAAAVRTEQRRRRREQQADTMQKIESSGQTADAWAEVRPVLDRVMSTLNDRDRDAVMLRFYDGQSFAEIGKRLRLSDNTARMRVERALEKLRTLLAERGVTSTVGGLALMLSSKSALLAPASLAESVAGAALASAARSAAPFLKLFHFAGTAKVSGVLSLAALLGFLSAGTGLLELKKYHREQAWLAAAGRQAAADQAQLHILNRKAQATEGMLHALQPAGLAATGPNQVGAVREPAAAQQFLAAYPEARALLASNGKAQFRKAFSAFYQQASLTPAQIQELEDRTIELWVDSTSIAPTGDMHATVALLPDDQLHALLGDRAFGQFQEYNRTLPARTFASRAAMAAGYAGAPLSQEQEEQLVRIVANNSIDYQNGLPVDLDAVEWAGAQAQAQTILAPSQAKAAGVAFLNFQYHAALAQAQPSQPSAPAPRSQSVDLTPGAGAP